MLLAISILSIMVIGSSGGVMVWSNLGDARGILASLAFVFIHSIAYNFGAPAKLMFLSFIDVDDP
jgi:hypothetical protein